MPTRVELFSHSILGFGLSVRTVLCIVSIMYNLALALPESKKMSIFPNRNVSKIYLHLHITRNPLNHP